MPASISIKNRDGKFVPMGQVNGESFTLPLVGAIDRSQPMAMELDFSRQLGQSPDDPDDDLGQELIAGNGRGEVLDTEVQIDLFSPGSQKLLGTFALKASIETHNEGDTGLTIQESHGYKAAEFTYTPAGGEPPTELKVLLSARR